VHPGVLIRVRVSFDKTRFRFWGEGSTTTPSRVLVVSNSENREVVTSAMNHWSIEAVPCSGVREARSLLPSARPSLIFCEEELPDGSYRELLQDVSKAAKTRVVVISPDAEQDTHYNEALALGAFDMIASPCRRSDVQWIAIRAMQDELRRAGGRRRSRLGPESLSSAPAPTNGEGTMPNGQ
jgi:DNA-binding NtrC family response regulator